MSHHDTKPPSCEYCGKPMRLWTYRSADRIDLKQEWRCENDDCSTNMPSFHMFQAVEGESENVQSATLEPTKEGE